MQQVHGAAGVTEAHGRAAAEQAGRRAAQCRERLARLAAGERHGRSDVERAHAALTTARIRALNAQISAMVCALRFEGSAGGVQSHDGAPRPMAEMQPSSSNDCLDRMRAQGIQLPELFEHYWSLGGSCSTLEIDAYLHLQFRLPRIERVLLDHALWELAL
jgi:hypothetical protein